MLKEWRVCLFFLLAVLFAIWILWWASSGFPLAHEICGEGNAADDCPSYNVILYSAWRLAEAADHWGVLITALATGAIGYFTFTLKQSTDKLWQSSEDTLQHARSEASQARSDRWRESIQFREQLDITNRATNAAVMSAQAGTRQAHVAEAALAQLERPYLFVFDISDLEADDYIDEAGPTGNLLLSVTYSVANYGKIPAIIKYAQAILGAGIEPPMPERLYDGHTLVAAPIFAAGERRDKVAQHHVWDGESGNDENGQTVPTLKNGESLFLWIILTYRGPFTDQHETRACWLYNESTGRFIPHGGPDHTGQK